MNFAKRDRVRLPLLTALLLTIGFLSARPAGAVQDPPALSAVSVDFSFFSPDGDGIQDEVRYRYTLDGDSAQVTVEVRAGDEAGPTGPTLVTLRDAFRATGADTVVWDGTNGGGVGQPDGYYWFVTSATNGLGSANAVPVRVYLDTTVPTITIVDVANPYTPGIASSDSLSRVTVNLTNVGNSDNVELTLRGPRPASTEAQTVQSVTTDGLQVVSWDGRAALDGLYAVSARIFDGAGHESSALGPDLNLDDAPPVGEFTLPTVADTNGIIRRIEALVSDRNGMSRLVLTVEGKNATFVDSLCPCLVDSVSIGFDLPDSVAASDTLFAKLDMIDVPGFRDSIEMTFVVDTLPPPPPVLDPLPPVVNLPDLAVSGTADDADSVFLYLNGALVAGISVPLTGSFGGTVVLDQPNNTLVAISQDVAGNRSVEGDTARVAIDQTIGLFVPEKFEDGDRVQVTLDEPGQSARVHIYTLSGKLVRILEDRTSTEFYSLPWDLLNTRGERVGSGPYVFRVVVTTGDGSKIEERVIAVVLQG